MGTLIVTQTRASLHIILVTISMVTRMSLSNFDIFLFGVSVCVCVLDMVVLPSLSCVQGELSESLLELALLLLQQERLCKVKGHLLSCKVQGYIFLWLHI